MRTSIRDPNNRNSKIWIVPDKGAAEFLAKLIPGARIVKIDAGIVEPTGKRPNRIRRYTNRERVAAYKARERAKRAEDIVTHARKCFRLLTSVREFSQARPPVHADMQNTKPDLTGDISCCEKPIQDSQLAAQTGDTAISFNKEDTGVSAFYESPSPITATAGGSLYLRSPPLGPWV
jgi:hypothetical protein